MHVSDMYVDELIEHYYKSLRLTELYIIWRLSTDKAGVKFNKIVCASGFSEISTCPSPA